MNGDHTEDNLLIARAFGYPDATASEMVGLTEKCGLWRVVDAQGAHQLEVAWPGGKISDRPEIRREVVLIYREACKKLGVSARQEHVEAPKHLAGESSAGGKRGTASTVAEDQAPASPKPFSQQLREGTWSDHSDSEGSGFMENIMRGRATLEDYVALVAQHYFMYEALEEVADRFSGDASFAPFHPAPLARMASLEADLAYLIGDDWRERITATPATAAYAARIRGVGEEGWVPGLVAHHYTRYLGDLSGGQMIAKRVVKQHGFDGAGVAFYSFPELGDLTEFKQRYRALLDSLGETLSAEERARVVDEVRTAYRFNTEAFIDLARARN